MTTLLSPAEIFPPPNLVTDLGAISGLVFATHRASLHDGPGLRTTVFLKGCPLRCQWCHNAESWTFQPTIRYQSSSCIACGECVAACPHACHAVDLHSGTMAHTYDRADCDACGTCTTMCPTGALKHIGTITTVTEILSMLARDQVAFAASGGGLTISGGEPLAQPTFAIALLTAARASGYKTCVETSLHVPQSTVTAATAITDHWLCDLKAIDETLHHQLTGVGVARIHANLDHLLTSGAKVHVRLPLIPGLNDSDDDLKALADFIAPRMNRLTGIEIMPYHRLGATKAAECGVAIHDRPSATHDQIQRWKAQLGLP